MPPNKALSDFLTSLGIEHTFEIVPGVAHDQQKLYPKLGDRAFEQYRKSFGPLATGNERKTNPRGDGNGR